MTWERGAEVEASGDVERCPLCGLSFDPSGQGCRPSCPLSKGCRVVCCPGCHYSFPGPSRVAKSLRRWMSWLEERRLAR